MTQFEKNQMKVMDKIIKEINEYVEETTKLEKKEIYNNYFNILQHEVIRDAIECLSDEEENCHDINWDKLAEYPGNITEGIIEHYRGYNHPERYDFYAVGDEGYNGTLEVIANFSNSLHDSFIVVHIEENKNSVPKISIFAKTKTEKLAQNIVNGMLKDLMFDCEGSGNPNGYQYKIVNKRINSLISINYVEGWDSYDEESGNFFVAGYMILPNSISTICIRNKYFFEYDEKTNQILQKEENKMKPSERFCVWVA